MQTARGSYYTFFSLVLSQELFTGSFVVSILFCSCFFFDGIHLSTHVLLSFHHIHSTTLADDTCYETCQQIFAADALCGVVAEDLLVEAFHPLLADHLAYLQTGHVSHVFLIDFGCAFVETFQEF